MTQGLDYQKTWFSCGLRRSTAAPGASIRTRATCRRRACRSRRSCCCAEEVTRVSETHASDEAFAAVSAEFQPKEVADLTIAIGLINLFNRLATSLRRPPGS